MDAKEKPLILSLETSTRAGSIAVLRGDSVLATKDGSEQNSHSSQLLFDVKEILQNAELDLKQINLIAAAVGPGSFTGLRIGLATAKALAEALDVPSCGVPTLLAAAAVSEKNGEVCAVLPAGRNEYFAQFFEKTNKNLIEKSKITTNKIETLIQKCEEKDELHLISVQETLDLFSGATINKSFSIQTLPANLAISIGQIAAEIFLTGNQAEHRLRPIYVRGADIGGSKNAA